MLRWLLHDAALNRPVAGTLRQRRSNPVQETSCIPSRPHGSQAKPPDGARATSPDRCRAPPRTRGVVLGDGARDSSRGRKESARCWGRKKNRFPSAVSASVVEVNRFPARQESGGHAVVSAAATS